MTCNKIAVRAVFSITAVILGNACTSEDASSQLESLSDEQSGSASRSGAASSQLESPSDEQGESASRSEGLALLAQRFDIPMYRGYRLDWCLVWASHCGRDAAHVFCLSRGYSGMFSYAAAWDVGPTMLIGTNQFCNAASCDSFLYIMCQ